MYIQVPPPVVLRDLVTDEPLSDGNVTDQSGRTLKSLGIAYENNPISMRKWFLRSISGLYKGYEEMKAARRTEKALARAEEDRQAGKTVIAEISKDDTKLLKDKIAANGAPADQLMQYETFLDAVEKMSDEKPRALKSVDEEKKDA